MEKAGIYRYCAYCGTKFYVPPWRAPRATYCRWDCSMKATTLDPEIKRLKHLFYEQRYVAEYHRGIAWKLTFEQWLKIWTDSGHLDQRGRRKGQYVMARLGDKGPYAVGNVKIVTATENLTERKMPRGSNNGWSKLTEAKVREIRALEGKMKRPEVAKRFGLNIWHVRDIQKRRAWAWLD